MKDDEEEILRSWSLDYAKEAGLDGEYDHTFFMAWLRPMLDSGQATVLVARDESGPVGYGIVVLQPEPLTGSTEVHQVLWYVTNPYRGTSLAEDLDRVMSEWGRQHGAVRMLSSHPGHSMAMRRYMKSLGYSPFMSYYKKEL